MKTRIEPTFVQKAIETIPGFDVFLCPVCKEGCLQRIEEISRARSPNSLYAILSKSA